VFTKVGIGEEIEAGWLGGVFEVGHDVEGSLCSLLYCPLSLACGLSVYLQQRCSHVHTQTPREKEREKERECVSKRMRVCESAHERVCVCE
jgi:cbb3-type cytochrome oxidase cytochrome c subunit